MPLETLLVVAAVSIVAVIGLVHRLGGSAARRLDADTCREHLGRSVPDRRIDHITLTARRDGALISFDDATDIAYLRVLGKHLVLDLIAPASLRKLEPRGPRDLLIALARLGAAPRRLRFDSTAERDAWLARLSTPT